MDFTFSDDQILFQQTTRDFLAKEVGSEKIRLGWDSPSGRSETLWTQLAELGLTAVTIPEHFGGLGMGVIDCVLLAQEAGYAALAEPLVHNALVAVPTLLAAESLELQNKWLPAIASGQARVAVGLQANLLVEDAHLADLLIVQRDGCVYAVPAGAASLSLNASIDPSRRLYGIDFEPAAGLLLAEDDAAIKLVRVAQNHGALGVAAECLGLAQRMVDMAVAYSCDRHQFGAAIGSFQAVKHLMANVAYKLEYARGPVYRAAYSLTHELGARDMHVSHAKLAGCEAAQLAASNSIQVHGAMGYTWEVDLHIFMKRAWVYNNAWGSAGFHKRRIAEYVFADNAALGPGNTFDLG